MLAARDFADGDEGSVGLGYAGRLDGLNDGLWCQSAKDDSDIGSWKLPDGSAVPDDLSAIPIYMANKPGQVGLLRVSGIGNYPYQGMYTCTIPDENGVSQTLVVWAARNPAYNASAGNCEFSIEQAVHVIVKACIFRATVDLSVLACGLVAKNSARRRSYTPCVYCRSGNLHC